MSNDAIGGRILNIGHVYKLQTRRDEQLHVWIMNIGRMKMSNDAIAGGRFRVCKRTRRQIEQRQGQGQG